MSIKQGGKSASDDLPPRILGNQVWCPVCNEHAQFIKIAEAAELARVQKRTIYRYIDEGALFTVRIVGKSRRVCSSCLVRQARE